MRNRYVACFTPCAPPLLVLTGNTDANGHFSVEFTSPTAGQVIGNATTSFTVNGATETRSTGDSHSGDASTATKPFAAARISIAPNATNAVGQPHTFTVTVLVIHGYGKWFIVLVVNQQVTVTLTNKNGASSLHVALPIFVLTGNTDANGHFSVEFTSPTAGQVIGNATTSFTVNGATETR